MIAGLLERQGIPVRVLARDPSRARAALGAAVEVVAGDLTKKETLPRAVEGAKHIIFTAGVRSGYPASEARIKATEYEGVVDTLAALRNTATAYGSRGLRSCGS